MGELEMVRSAWEECRETKDRYKSQLAEARAEVRSFMDVANSNAKERDEAHRQLSEAQAKLDAINTPELHDFTKAVTLEAQHQRLRWGVDHDAGKEPQDWFWLLGYLGGKALRAHIEYDIEKALHHTITVAAACANWHAAILGNTNMRPGINPAKVGVVDAEYNATIGQRTCPHCKQDCGGFCEPGDRRYEGDE